MHNQLNNHDPENGEIGDCFRTCVANYLGVHPSEVPCPESLHDKTTELIRPFLEEKGLSFFWHSFRHELVGDEPWVHWAEREKNQNQMYILNGRRTKNGTDHSCLYKNGQLVHDPAGGDGLHFPMIVDDEHIWVVYTIVKSFTASESIDE